MLTESNILSIARKTLELESKSISSLTEKLNKSFVEIVHRIINIDGRVVITGIGKSAIIAQKIVATLNSTGTASMYMHAADAIHGDLGMIRSNDLVICISKSGSSPEIKALVPLLKQGSNTLVGMTGDMQSYLAKESDLVLDTTVEKEACPNNLAPTTSTTAQMAMGDALAVVLLSCRDFKAEDFAKFHPGGALGKKLYLRVEALSDLNAKPVLKETDDLKACILAITKGRMGAAVVCEDDKVKGIITDGDLRRMLSNATQLEEIRVADIMTKNPKTLESSALAVEAVQMINEFKINHVIATRNGKFEGIIHIQDLMREGLI
ncbi:KpsF/GutQ family sugar-phosphate isomerase [bacterium]|nr:KpsF/GutQ family sugar-phosphate isomerase [bacterium]